MSDTGSWVGEEDAHRLAALYTPDRRTGRVLRSPLGDRALEPQDCRSGNGGRISTASDCDLFAELLRRGGELDALPILGLRTVRYMTQNHLPGGRDLEAVGRSLLPRRPSTESARTGFSVTLNSVANRVLGSPGEFAWGRRQHLLLRRPGRRAHRVVLHGAAALEHVPHQAAVRQLVYQALVD